MSSDLFTTTTTTTTNAAAVTATVRPLLVRSFELDMVEGDGRTIEARLVPYNTPALVADPPLFKPYRESILAGAFKAQTGAANRVLMNVEHEQGIGGLVGRGLALADTDSELRGTFRMLDGHDSDKALELVRAGVLTGLSVEFFPLKSRKVDGVMQRMRAHLDKVSLCRFPAYPEAQVLAVRTEPHEDDPAAAVETANPELMERIAALGIVPILHRAVTRKPWDGSPARFTDEEYQRSCLIDRGGDAPVKERCSLPVLEPNGDLNVNALGAAAAALRGARGGLSGVSGGQKATAARKLVRYYRMAEMTPPPGITMMAGGQ